MTGAGVSVESGIPPFRGKGGVWERIDPMTAAHIDAFIKNPKKVWETLLLEMKRVVDAAAPNPAHTGLFALENMGMLRTVITQNVDGLHQAAGSSDVIEFHGNFAWLRCQSCNDKTPSRKLRLDTIPPKCACGGYLRPDLVFFGEMIPPAGLSRSRQAARSCDLMLVMGTSAVVQPAASIPIIAGETGSFIIEINPEPTELTRHVSDLYIPLSAGRALPEIVSEIEKC